MMSQEEKFIAEFQIHRNESVIRSSYSDTADKEKIEYGKGGLTASRRDAKDSDSSRARQLQLRRRHW